MVIMINGKRHRNIVMKLHLLCTAKKLDFDLNMLTFGHISTCYDLAFSTHIFFLTKGRSNVSLVNGNWLCGMVSWSGPNVMYDISHICMSIDCVFRLVTGPCYICISSKAMVCLFYYAHYLFYFLVNLCFILLAYSSCWHNFQTSTARARFYGVCGLVKLILVKLSIWYFICWFILFNFFFSALY